MKRLLFLALLGSGSTVYSQGIVSKILQRTSIEGFGGLANYQGELQDSRYTFSQSKPAIGLGASIAITDRFSLRGMATVGNIQAADAKSSNPLKQNRNLSFYSRIYDLSATGVYEIFDIMEKRYTPYVFAGISVYHFSPYTYDSTGKRRYLVAWNTEGQGFPEYPDRKVYALTQISIPFGAGIRFAVNEKVSLGWEFRFNKTFTDYIDDVSTRYVDESVMLARRGSTAVALAYRGGESKNGDPNYPAAGTVRGNDKTKDWYYFSGLTLTYRLFRGDKEFGSSSSGKQLSCPKNVY